jgi:hypothetical protein
LPSWVCRGEETTNPEKEIAMRFLIFRPDRQLYLTPQYLRWDADRAKAQICEDRKEAETIRDWLAGICIRVQFVPNE